MINILIKKCIACGKKLIKLKNQNKFCSRKCFYVFQDKRKVLKCLICSKDFKEQIGRIKTGRGKYCSHECYSKSLIGKPNTSNTKFKKGFIPWNKGRPWTSEERQKITDALPKRFGKDAGNWKGGTTRLRSSIMGLKKYKRWRTEIFIRDKHTCQHCGAKRKKGDRVIINADHIKPVYKIVAEYKIKTTMDALKCPELWDTSNGRTLCISCHKQTSSYGTNQYKN